MMTSLHDGRRSLIGLIYAGDRDDRSHGVFSKAGAMQSLSCNCDSSQWQVCACAAEIPNLTDGPMSDPSRSSTFIARSFLRRSASTRTRHCTFPIASTQQASSSQWLGSS
eukprot:1125614-Rhodomonas_salina.4